MTDRLEEIYKQYRRKQIAELADWTPEIDMVGVSISEADLKDGSPKDGDKIARNPKNHQDRWLVAMDYFSDNFESVILSLDKQERKEVHVIDCPMLAETNCNGCIIAHCDKSTKPVVSQPVDESLLLNTKQIDDAVTSDLTTESLNEFKAVAKKQLAKVQTSQQAIGGKSLLKRLNAISNHHKAMDLVLTEIIEHYEEEQTIRAKYEAKDRNRVITINEASKKIKELETIIRELEYTLKER